MSQKQNRRKRFSMPTYIQPRPKSFTTLKQTILLSFILAFIIVMIIFIYNGFEQKQVQCQNQNIEKDQLDKKQLVLFDNQSFKKVDLNSIQIELQKQKPYEQYLQCSVQTTKMFKQIQKFDFSDESIQKFMEKIQLFEVIKHKKLTSPKNIKLSWYDTLNPFFKPDLYQDIDNIFHQNTQQGFVWRSSGNYLTFHSVNPIQLSLIKIQVYMQIKVNKYLYLIGLSAYDTIITNQHTLQSQFIQKFNIQNLTNLLQCKNPSCQRQYSMIMIYLEPIQIRKIEIYTKKKRRQ